MSEYRKELERALDEPAPPDRLRELIVGYRTKIEGLEQYKADYHDKWLNALLKLKGVEQ